MTAVTGSTLAEIIIPIATAIGLAVWLIPVMRQASRTPGDGSQTPPPDQSIRGGTFVGDPRQQMPDPRTPVRPGRRRV